jgi:N-acetylneuraminic acid mutarotase
MKYLGSNNHGHHELILFGGHETSSEYLISNSNDVYILNYTLLEWRKLAIPPQEIPAGRYWGDLFVVNPENVVIFGGFSGNLSEYEVQDKYHDDVWNLNLQTLEWTKLPNHTVDGIAPIGRGNFVSTLRSNWLVVVGGYSPTRGEMSDSWAFNVQSCEWQELTLERDQFPSVWGHAWAEIAPGHMICSGGEGGWNQGGRNMNANFYTFTFLSISPVKAAKR